MPVSKRKKVNLFPIVAIGASAGGLEAVSELLKQLPAKTGMSFFYIQHLDPLHKSSLSEILKRSSKIKIQEAKNLSEIRKDCLYILPPNKLISIHKNKIKLSPRPERPIANLPINHFFTSLAESHKECAIGVILSGNASDGVIGLKAIKVSGGITFAQNDSAKFQSMPSNAISAGVVDFVLSPAEIGKELSKIANKDYALLSPEDFEEEESDKNHSADLRSILEIIYKTSGVNFLQYKKNTITRRVMRRMILHKLDSLNKYKNFLQKNPEELEQLYNDLLINVTRFFRDEPLLDQLKSKYLPKIIKSKSDKEAIRIWVAGCSTGEEAYSLAMLISELVGDKLPKTRIQIFATDLSGPAIQKARLGIYSKEELAQVSEKRIHRFFTKLDGSYRISKLIRDMCVFAQHNILKDPPFSKLDLISCCNLLIYLDGTLQKKIMHTFHYSLVDNGILVLGKSETTGTPALFSSADKKVKIFKRKNEVKTLPAIDLTKSIKSIDKSQEALKTGKTFLIRRSNRNETVEKQIDKILLTDYTPACILVNHEMEILQFRGNTNIFLDSFPGKASLNVLKMARPGLAFEIKTGLQKVIRSHSKYRKSGITILHNEINYLVGIEISPLDDKDPDTAFLIVFNYTPVLPDEGSIRRSDKRILQLEKELIAAKEEMRTAIEEQEAANEELQSANEEIVSNNEELQSINEELETSKEELESTNEELIIVNQEMQIRNDQLSESYEYNELVYSTIRESVLLLDSSLRIKKANERFYTLFRLAESDCEGTSVFDVGDSMLDFPDFRDLVYRLSQQKTVVQEFQINNNFKKLGIKNFLINAVRINQKTLSEYSLLFAIEDITEHVIANKIVSEREEWFSNMADNAPVMIWVSTENLLRTFFNQAWLSFTGKKADEESGNGWAINIHKDDVEKVLARYTEAYEKREDYHIEYRLRRNDGAYRWVKESGRPNIGHDGTFKGFIGTCTEIHDQHTLNTELEALVKVRTKALFESNKNLQRTNNELRQFAYVASHDLQEPLRKIITFTDRLNRKYKEHLPAEAAEFLTKISNSSLRMSRLITDLLNFSKATSSEEQFVITDLNKILENVLKDFDLIITEKGAVINQTPLPAIEGIPVELFQLFHNLISNSLKFIKTGQPRIDITCKEIKNGSQIKDFRLIKNKKYFEIIISDNGIGFENEHAEQIFTIFQRLNNKKDFIGTGIGLALCKKIVAYHNGFIYAEGEKGKGSRFHIILPERRS